MLRERYLWDGNNVQLRKTMLRFLTQHADKFRLKYASEHGYATMEDAIPWAHERATEIFQQGFIEPKDLRDDPRRVFAWLSSISLSLSPR
jgi:hypothetical protein